MPNSSSLTQVQVQQLVLHDEIRRIYSVDGQWLADFLNSFVLSKFFEIISVAVEAKEGERKKAQSNRTTGQDKHVGKKNLVRVTTYEAIQHSLGSE